MPEKSWELILALVGIITIGVRSMEALIGKALFHKREDRERERESSQVTFSEEDRRKITAMHESELERRPIYERIVDLLEQIERNTEKLREQNNRGGYKT